MNIRIHNKYFALDEKKKNVRYTNLLYDADSKKIINFTVIQFYMDKNEKPHEVIKHDFSHGCYNVHKYYLGHESRSEFPGISITNQLYHDAKNDINQNWQSYAMKYRIRQLPMEFEEH